MDGCLPSPRTPTWTCKKCHTGAQWACRIKCRSCGLSAHPAALKLARAGQEQAQGSYAAAARRGAQQPQPAAERAEVQRLRRELEAYKDKEAAQEANQGDAADPKDDTASAQSEDDATAARLAAEQKALQALPPVGTSETIDACREQCKQSIQKLKDTLAAAKPGHVRRRTLEQQRRKQQLRVHELERQDTANTERIALLEEQAAAARKKGETLRDQKAEATTRIASLDAQIAELSAHIATALPDKYKDLPQEMAAQYRDLDAAAELHRAHAAATAAKEPNTDKAADEAPPHLGGDEAPRGEEGSEAADEAMGDTGTDIPESDEALDEACAKAGLPHAHYGKADPSLKRTLLQTFNLGKRGKVS